MPEAFRPRNHNKRTFVLIKGKKKGPNASKRGEKVFSASNDFSARKKGR